MARKSLRERLAWPSTLERAFVEVISRTNPDSAGPDGLTADSFRRNSRAQLAQLRRDIQSDVYSHSLGRGVAIPKKQELGLKLENVRPITVFNVRDRIVQRAICNLIWQYLRDHVFSDVSYGGIRAYRDRAGRVKPSPHARKNVEAAALRIMELRRDGHCFTFETDIERFYPSVDKERLLSGLRAVLPDNSLTDVLIAVVSTEISNSDAIEARGLSECWDPEVGIPQGSVLSPLLANFYLAEFDRSAAAAGFKLVRYVDDLVILTRSAEEAESAYHFCKKQLDAIGLTIHPLGEKNSKGKIKTQIVGRNHSFDFLGLRINRETIHPSDSKVNDLQDRIRQITFTRGRHSTLVQVVESLNRLLRGWMTSYSFCDLPNDLQRKIDHLAGTGLASWMNYHGLIRSKNDLTSEKRKRIGLWSASEAEIRPISRRVFRARVVGPPRDAKIGNAVE